MDAVKFYRDVLQLLETRDVSTLIGGALVLAIEAAGATSAHLEIPEGPLEGVWRPGPDAAHDPNGPPLTVPVTIDDASGFLRIQFEALREIGALPCVELLAGVVGLALERILRSEPRMPLNEEIQALRERRVTQALARHGNNASAAARDLDVARSHIYDVAAAIRRRRRGSSGL
ncbi:MAG: hypothetical protein KIT31_01070 [Deltaproteobacteria bacterium]|nr:hypothetical protein [Deltaproteobacteria bacterium]